MVPTKEQIIDLHINNRISYKEIGKMFKMSWAQVQQLAHKKYGIDSPLYPQSLQKSIDIEKVKKMYMSGMSAPKIAKALGLKNEPIYTILHKAKIVRKMSKALQGNKIWVGKKHSEETRVKLSKARMGKYTGEKNPNWQGGKKHSNQNKRLSLEYKWWRIAVKKRDGRCLECGSLEKLHAHHIQAVRHTDDIKILTDLSNGITLCKNCHKKTFYKEKEYEIFYRALLEKAVNSGKI